MRVLDAILLFSREYLVIFFLLICLFFVEPFPNLEPLPNLEPFPNPSLKGREMRAFPQPFPKRAFPLPFPKGTGDESLSPTLP